MTSGGGGVWGAFGRARRACNGLRLGLQSSQGLSETFQHVGEGSPEESSNTAAVGRTF